WRSNSCVNRANSERTHKNCNPLRGNDMKALVCEAYGPVDNLVYREFPDPVPAENEVLVDVEAIGVNFPDGLLVEGKYQARPQCPFIPGSEFAGKVAALGPGAQGFAVGDRVFG